MWIESHILIYNTRDLSLTHMMINLLYNHHILSYKVTVFIKFLQILIVKIRSFFIKFLNEKLHSP